MKRKQKYKITTHIFLHMGTEFFNIIRQIIIIRKTRIKIDFMALSFAERTFKLFVVLFN